MNISTNSRVSTGYIPSLTISWQTSKVSPRLTLLDYPFAFSSLYVFTDPCPFPFRCHIAGIWASRTPVSNGSANRSSNSRHTWSSLSAWLRFACSIKHFIELHNAHHLELPSCFSTSTSTLTTLIPHTNGRNTDLIRLLYNRTTFCNRILKIWYTYFVLPAEISTNSDRLAKNKKSDRLTVTLQLDQFTLWNQRVS